MLNCFLPDLLPADLDCIQSSLCRSITFNPIFNFSEHHLHEQRLWAHPSTPNTTKHHGEQNDEYKKYKKRNCQENKILRPKCVTQNNKPSLYEVEQQQRLSCYFYKWS